jgi:Protein ChrB, N-terminal
MWELFLYRLPSEPSRARVGVWRELRKLGALPLGQTLVAVPASERFVHSLDAVETRVAHERGTSYRFSIEPSDEQRRRLEAEWNALREHEYSEIIEECERKFLKEIEFEIFRGNLTASEAEEIEADLEKIKRWAERVGERDLFGAPGARQVRSAIRRAQAAFDDFLERVYQVEQRRGPILDIPEDIPWGEFSGDAEEPAEVVDLPEREEPRRRPRKTKNGRSA